MNKTMFAALVFVLAASVASLAQRGPSFDCAKASNTVERAICQDPTLAAADREMAAAYSALAAKLAGPAKAHLVMDQKRWLDSRNRDCEASDNDPGDCLESRYAGRIKHLKALGAGSYPFIGTQSIYKMTLPGAAVRYSIDISYPQFDGSTADFSAINRRFADNAATIADRLSSDGFGSSWSYSQGFVIDRPATSVVSIGTIFSSARGRYDDGTSCTLVDLATGRPVGPEGVFRPGDDWLTLMVEVVGAHLREQFGDNHNFDEVLAPANLAKPLRDPAHYCYRADRLELVFNRGVIASPYAGASFSIDVPYARLKPLLRADGPLGRK